MTKAEDKYDASTICGRRTGKLGLKMIFSQLWGSIRPSASSTKPAGVCIQELTDRIQKADIKVPSATTQVAAKCKRGPTFSIPNSITPRKPASRKNALSTSYPINGPITGPALSEKALQFVPN